MFKSLFIRNSRFRTDSLSDKGLRGNNEDSLAVERIAENTYFLAVADGMGGKAGGEIASNIVISSVTDFLKSVLTKNISNKTLSEYLEKAFLIAQNSISEKISANPELKGMGTTMTALLIKDGKYVWGNIGDSRMYLLSEGHMKLVTEDHSYIQDFISRHKEKLPQSVLDRYKNIVTRIIDGGNDKPDIFPSKNGPAELKEGDMFLICSDGLITDKIKDQTSNFEDIISKNKSLRKIAQRLVSMALENGSDDNITVVLGLNGELVVKPPEDKYQTIRIVKDPEK